MKSSSSIAMAGFLATAVAFGPARIGYGLFLPEFRSEFSFSTGIAGIIASSTFVSFLLALVGSAVLVARYGERLPVVVGSLCAALGMSVVALAPSSSWLAAGLTLAAASAGFCWTPFNNAAKRRVDDAVRGRVLSVISTGTTFGIAGAGLLGLGVYAFGDDWRYTWAVFAMAAFVAAAVDFLVLRRKPGEWQAEEAETISRSAIATLAASRTWPLYATAIAFGIVNSIHFSFAVDHVTELGGFGLAHPEALSGYFFLAFGLGGTPGLLAGEVEARIGPMRLAQAVMAVAAISLGLVVVAPQSIVAVLASAALQGACVMTISVVFSIWSIRLHPTLPSLSFTAVLMAMAAGNVVAPAVAGSAGETFGFAPVFAAAAILAAVTAVGLPVARRGAGAAAKSTPSEVR